jgi:hypothetical protein
LTKKRILTGLGIKYGTNCRSKESHTIGVFVNITRGEIGFSINGTFHGIGFSGEELKEGPFYPAIALREGGEASFSKVTRNPDEFLMK